METRLQIRDARRHLLATACWLIAMWIAPIPLHAAAPANDNCSGALVLSGSGPFPLSSALVNLTEATTGALEVPLTNALCIAPVSRGVWFRFRPVTGGYYTLSTCSPATTVEDTVMAVYTAVNCGSFTAVECNDYACGLDGGLASVTAPLAADTDYYVAVWKYGTAAPTTGKGTVQLIISRETPPANDTCLTAQPVFLNTLVAGSTVLASNNYQLPAGSACFTGIGHSAQTADGRDVVYTFTTKEAGDYSFKVFNYRTDGDFDLVLYVGAFRAPGTGPQTVSTCYGAANRNPANTAEEVMCLGLAAGQQVYIYVDDAGDNIGSSFLLEVSRCRREVEPNNAMTNASPLSCGIEGSIASTADSDFFLVGRYPPGSRLFALLDGESASLSAFDMRVVTPPWTNVLEFDNGDNDARFGEFSPNIAGTPLPGGDVFLRINANAPQGREPYRLYAVVQPATNSAAIEAEPNQTLALANIHPANYYLGSLAGPAPSTDQDLYRFSAADGDLVFVSLDGDPSRDGTPLNAQVELLDEFGNVLVIVSDPKNSSDTTITNQLPGATVPNFPAESLVHRCAEGTYYVRVSVGLGANGLPQTGPSGSGDYLLSISKNCIRGPDGFNTDPSLNNVAVAPAVMEGGTVTLTGNAWDPDIGDTATLAVDWGDGLNETVSLNAPGLNAFSLPHQYPDNQPSGTYTITVTVSDASFGTASLNIPATVTNAPPALLNVAVTSPVNVGSNAVLTGTIIDAGMLDTFMLSVNWGDGSPAENFPHPAGGGAFSHGHTYTNGGTNFLIHLTLTDDDGGAASASVPVQVNSAAQPAQFVGINRLGDGTMSLQLTGTPLAAYRILASSNLIDWAELAATSADAAGQILYIDTTPPPGSRFYRAVAP